MNEKKITEEMNRRQEVTGGCGRPLLFAIVVLLVVLWLTACTTTKIVTVDKVRTDTAYIVKNQRDSVYVRDSIHVREKGDTIWIERWHERWRDRVTHDTILRATHDTIPMPYEVEVIREVAIPLTWWQQTRMHAGELLFALLIGAAAFAVWRLKRK